MLRTLLALVVLLALLCCGMYFWKLAPGSPRLSGLGELRERLASAKTLAAVKAALALNRSLKPLGISASVEAGVATLRGDVPNAELKRQAERVVAAVPDVQQVVSELRVVPGKSAPAASSARSLGESLDDGALEVQARLALSLRKELRGTDVAVRAFRRELTLAGEVARPDQRELAQATALQVEGVKDVVNQLRVRADAPASSAAAAAEAALQANANLRGYGLKVTEKGGQLVLRGRVRTGAERDLAGLLAREAASVPVENALEIRP